MNKEQLINEIKESGASKIKFAVCDLDGILRGKYIHKEKFLSSLEKGLGFCDVVFGWDSGDACYDNTQLTGLHTGYPDATARIDLNTFRKIPWENGQFFFLADFGESAGDHKFVCPRSLLKKIEADFSEAGLRVKSAFEYEWFNFKGTPGDLAGSGYRNMESLAPGMFGYSVLRTALNNKYFNDIFDGMESFNIPLEGLHTETGPGVMEAAIIYDSPLNSADKAILFKTGVKEIAYKNEIVATFMAKWNSNLPGCGGHLHQSLWDANEETNLFYDEKSKNGMSKTMEHFLAGQLACLPEILPMFAPTVNSYKRIGKGDWAPANVSWGIDNRTGSLRVIPGNNTATRIEMRVPGADANPYLALAASLASGLYGVQNKLRLTAKQSTGNSYGIEKNEKLPETLHEATEKMANSKLAKKLFGEYFVDHFTKTREWEWKLFSKQVSDWELKRYLEII